MRFAAQDAAPLGEGPLPAGGLGTDSARKRQCGHWVLPPLAAPPLAPQRGSVGTANGVTQPVTDPSNRSARRGMAGPPRDSAGLAAAAQCDQ